MLICFNKMKSLYKYIEMWDCLSNIFFLCVVFFFFLFLEMTILMHKGRKDQSNNVMQFRMAKQKYRNYRVSK